MSISITYSAANYAIEHGIGCTVFTVSKVQPRYPSIGKALLRRERPDRLFDDVEDYVVSLRYSTSAKSRLNVGDIVVTNVDVEIVVVVNGYPHGYCRSTSTYDDVRRVGQLL